MWKMVRAYVNKTSHMPHSSPRWIILHLLLLPGVVCIWMLDFQISEGLQMQPKFSQYQLLTCSPRFSVKTHIVEGGSTCYASCVWIAGDKTSWMYEQTQMSKPKCYWSISNSSSYFLKCFSAPPNLKHSIPFTFPLNFLNPRVF